MALARGQEADYSHGRAVPEAPANKDTFFFRNMLPLIGKSHVGYITTLISYRRYIVKITCIIGIVWMSMDDEKP